MPLGSLTLVLPTFNRAALLRRALRYYASRGIGAHIIVADSSDDGSRSANQALVEGLQSILRIDYIGYPQEIAPMDKTRDAVARVETPFISMTADDDLFSLGGLERATRFLADHPDYSVAHGEALGFELAETDAAHGPIKVIAEYPQRDVEGSTAAGRLIGYLNAYWTVWYSVHRTEQLRSNWQIVVEGRFDHLFVELLFASLDIVQGKAKRMDGLYMVRQTLSAKNYDTMLWRGGPEWDSQRIRFCEIVAAQIAKADGISHAAALQRATYALSRYLWVIGFIGEKPDPPDDMPYTESELRSGEKLPNPVYPREGTATRRVWSAALSGARRMLRGPRAGAYRPSPPDLGPWMRLADEFEPIYDAIRGTG